MLEKYRHLIYENENSRKKVENDCLNIVINENHSYTKEEILKNLSSDEPNKINTDYNFNLLMAEGEMLFNLASKKFGYNLWNNVAWKDKNCKKKCPFGDVCQKRIIHINNDKFCYGQLYLKKINSNQLKKLSESHMVKITNYNNSVYIDMNTNYDIQVYENFFYEYMWFIWWFGDKNNKKIYGENIIKLL